MELTLKALLVYGRARWPACARLTSHVECFEHYLRLNRGVTMEVSRDVLKQHLQLFAEACREDAEARKDPLLMEQNNTLYGLANEVLRYIRDEEFRYRWSAERGTARG